MLKTILTTMFLSSVVMLSFSSPANAMRQPAMERSLQVLQNAERILRRARRNKGGHRYKALQHIQDAMYEIRAGIDYANRRPAGGQLKRKNNPQTETPKRRKHDYGEREWTERDEHDAETEYLKNRY